MDAAIKVQARVIYALMMQEVHTIYGNTKLGYIWALFQTTTQVLIFWIIRTVTKFTPPHGMHIFLFLLTGFALFTMFRGTINKCMSAVTSNNSLLTFPQVTPVDLMISRTLLLWATEMVASLVMLSIAVTLGMPLAVTDYGKLFFALLISPLLGLGVGMTCASLTVIFPVINRLLPLFMRALFLTSGVFFSLSRFPSYIIKWLWWNPMLQIIECGRSALSRGYDSVDYSVVYIVSATVLFLCLGFLFERYVRGKSKR